MVSVGGIASRCLGEGGKVCGLGERDIFRRLSEEILRRLFSAIDSAAIGSLVEVDVEDLVFRRDLFELYRQDDFFRFADKGLVLGKKGILHDLLGDRGAALATISCHKVKIHEDGAQERHGAESEMLIKAVVLDGHSRVADIGGYLFKRDFCAAHGAMNVKKQDVAGTVVDLGRFADDAILDRID